MKRTLSAVAAAVLVSMMALMFLGGLLKKAARAVDGLRAMEAVKHVMRSARKDKRGVDLISDALPFSRLWYDTPDNAVGYAMHSSRSHDAVIRVYDAAGNVIEVHRHKGDFVEP